MSLPRLSLDGLINRLSLERATLAVIVEGFEDKGILSFLLADLLNRLSIYAIDEIDVSANNYSEYGGNKGRVITLLTAEPLESYVDQVLVGIVDRDTDSILSLDVVSSGLYYTEYYCLIADRLDLDGISSVIEKSFAVALTEEQKTAIGEFTIKFSSLKAMKRACACQKSLPDFSRHVKRTGSFDWTAYMRAVSANSSGALDEQSFREFCKGIDCTQDLRMFSHDHSIYEFLYALLKVDRKLDRTVSLQEVGRHFVANAKSLGCAQEVLEMIVAKVAANDPSQSLEAQ